MVKKRKFDDWAKPHHYARKRYNDALLLAEYYRWCAARGFSLCGRNPLTGKERAKMYEPHYSVERREAVLVHKCQARFWQQEARKLRDYGLV